MFEGFSKTQFLFIIVIITKMHRKLDEVEIDESQQLGKGATGNVYVGYLGSQQVAVKCIDLHKVNNQVTRYLLSCEIAALSQLSKGNNPNIVKLFGLTLSTDSCYLITEILLGGSLSNLIKQNPKGIKWPRATNIIMQVAQGYQELKRHGIVHRDIKPDNIIFKNKSEATATLIDFGYCTKKDVPNQPEAYYNVGSPRYMAPEAYKNNQYSEKSDIWALGIILYEMLTGSTFDAGKSIEQTFQDLEMHGIPYPSFIEEPLRRLLEGMLKLHPPARFTSEQLIGELQKLHQQPQCSINCLQTFRLPVHNSTPAFVKGLQRQFQANPKMINFPQRPRNLFSGNQGLRKSFKQQPFPSQQMNHRSNQISQQNKSIASSQQFQRREIPLDGHSFSLSRVVDNNSSTQIPSRKVIFSVDQSDRKITKSRSSTINGPNSPKMSNYQEGAFGSFPARRMVAQANPLLFGSLLGQPNARIKPFPKNQENRSLLGNSCANPLMEMRHGNTLRDKEQFSRGMLNSSGPELQNSKVAQRAPQMPEFPRKVAGNNQQPLLILFPSQHVGSSLNGGSEQINSARTMTRAKFVGNQFNGSMIEKKNREPVNQFFGAQSYFPKSNDMPFQRPINILPSRHQNNQDKVVFQTTPSGQFRNSLPAPQTYTRGPELMPVRFQKQAKVVIQSGSTVMRPGFWMYAK